MKCIWHEVGTAFLTKYAHVSLNYRTTDPTQPNRCWIWFISALQLANSLLFFLRAKSVLHVHIQLGHCTNSHILISYLIMFHIWPHLAHFFSLGTLSPETGDQNCCQTYLTLAKQWAADKHACLSRLPLASLHAWHCPRLAWQCPAWHR